MSNTFHCPAMPSPEIRSHCVAMEINYDECKQFAIHWMHRLQRQSATKLLLFMNSREYFIAPDLRTMVGIIAYLSIGNRVFVYGNSLCNIASSMSHTSSISAPIVIGCMEPYGLHILWTNTCAGNKLIAFCIINLFESMFCLLLAPFGPKRWAKRIGLV